MKSTLRTGNKNIVAIVVVVVASVAILYLVLANLLFSRTYEMLSASMKARGESNVSRLAERVSWGLAAHSQDHVNMAIETFKTTNRETSTIIVLDTDREIFARVGGEELSIFTGEFKHPDTIASRMKDGYLLAVAPSRDESANETVGYVFYSESSAGYLKYRQNMIIIALLASLLGLVIVGKLLHSQISVSIENSKLLESLEKQAADLRATNVDLQSEIEVRTRTEAELAEYRLHLEDLVEERTLELKKTKDRLVEASRKAGMAEVATGVLHNVGNVLNSVTVSAGLLRDMVDGMHVIESIKRSVALIEEHSGDLGAFFTENRKGKILPKYLAGLADLLEGERSQVLERLDDLKKKIDQVKVIVSLQQSYASVGGATEKCVLMDIIEDAIQINMAGFKRHRTRLERDYHDTPDVVVDKHKLVQILVNLLSNAKYALKSSTEDDRVITVRTRVADENSAEIAVEDTGMGIPRENLTRIFNYGFTTRKEGHGFGLHSSANAAKDLGGTLMAHSEGEGKGAKFVLSIPMRQADDPHD